MTAEQKPPNQATAYIRSLETLIRALAYDCAYQWKILHNERCNLCETGDEGNRESSCAWPKPISLDHYEETYGSLQ